VRCSPSGLTALAVPLLELSGTARALRATLTASPAPALYLLAFALGARLRIRALELAVTARGLAARRPLAAVESLRSSRISSRGYDRRRRKADDAEWRRLVAPVRISRSSTFQSQWRDLAPPGGRATDLSASVPSPGRTRSVVVVLVLLVAVLVVVVGGWIVTDDLRRR
jgi:hypothetical protein